MEPRFRQRRMKKRSGLDFRVSDKRDKEIVETRTNKEEGRWIFDLDRKQTRKNENRYSRGFNLRFCNRECRKRRDRPDD